VQPLHRSRIASCTSPQWSGHICREPRFAEKVGECVSVSTRPVSRYYTPPFKPSQDWAPRRTTTRRENRERTRAIDMSRMVVLNSLVHKVSLDEPDGQCALPDATTANHYQFVFLDVGCSSRRHGCSLHRITANYGARCSVNAICLICDNKKKASRTHFTIQTNVCGRAGGRVCPPARNKSGGAPLSSNSHPPPTSHVRDLL
jgi:hypothetical protein